MGGDLVLAGLAERTRTGYLRALRQLSEFHDGRDPRTLREADLRRYLLWLRQEKRAAGSLKIAISGLRFCFRTTCPRDWSVLERLRIPSERPLPAVLTREEVRRIIAAACKPRFRAYLWTVYSCGLRLNEALALQVGDIDAARMRLHIHRGKGAQDRLVPLPASTLGMLREYWVTHRHPSLLFPKTDTAGRARPGGRQTMSPSTVQGGLRRIVVELGFRKRVSIHPFAAAQPRDASAGRRRQSENAATVPPHSAFRYPRCRPCDRGSPWQAVGRPG